jgi:hypothetical protein
LRPSAASPSSLDYVHRPKRLVVIGRSRAILAWGENPGMAGLMRLVENHG